MCVLFLPLQGKGTVIGREGREESVVKEGPARERKSIIKIGFSNSAQYTQGKRRKRIVDMHRDDWESTDE